MTAETESFAAGRVTRLPPLRPRPHGSRLGLLAVPLWLALFAGVIAFAAQDVGLTAQYMIGAAALVALAALHVFKPAGLWRVILISVVVFVSIRYITWRTLNTIPPVDSSGFVPGLLLYLAELQGFFVLLLGVFVNVRPRQSTAAPRPSSDEAWPTVDIFVPSYNEDPDLLRVTLTAAMQIDYPSDRMTVHLLDDGGTEDKCNHVDPRIAQAAEERREILTALCERLGVTYRTRAHNVHAKAGNINAALPDTDGELVLILDADHVPTQDILKNTVGHFLDRPDLFLVQTPHFFHTPDPVERNLGTFDRMPSEQEMFYGAIQKGLDSWNGSFFCGSAALLRRDALLQIGGIATTSITEDAETALELHARGYSSLYVDRPMVAGLAPDTVEAFVVQRIRWAQGMAQILLLKNPLFKRGLGLAQRLCYLNSATFWLFPFSRLVFLIAPLFYLLFGLKIFEASLDEFSAFVVFHVVCSLMLSNWLFGRSRWPFVSDLYELVQSPFTFGALASVVRNPRKPQFRVTPKNVTVERDFVPGVGKPFFAILGVLVAAAAIGVWRWFDMPFEREHLTIVMVWNLINLVLAVAAAGAMYERSGKPVGGWVKRLKPVNVLGYQTAGRGNLVQVGLDGARLRLGHEQAAALDLDDGRVIVQMAVPGRTDLRLFPALIQGRTVDRDTVSVDLTWVPQNEEEDRDLIAVVFGDSQAWVDFQAGRIRQRTILGGLLYLFVSGFARVADLAFGRRPATGTEIRPVWNRQDA